MAPSARGRQRKAREEVVVNVTWRGREVEAPPLRQLAALAALILAPVMAFAGMAVAVAWLALAAALVPLTFPLHLLLRLLGRRGFVDVGGGRVRYAVEREGFRRAR